MNDYHNSQIVHIISLRVGLCFSHKNLSVLLRICRKFRPTLSLYCNTGCNCLLYHIIFTFFYTYIFFNRSLNKDHSVCMNKAHYCSQGLGSGLILSGSGSRSNLSGSTIFSRQDPDPGTKTEPDPDSGSRHLCLENFPLLPFPFFDGPLT